MFTGNNWGCEDGECGLGLGPQEEFWGCSDIAIRATSVGQEETSNGDKDKDGASDANYHNRCTQLLISTLVFVFAFLF